MISPYVSSRIHETVPGHNTMDGLYFHPSVATSPWKSEVSHFSPDSSSDAASHV